MEPDGLCVRSATSGPGEESAERASNTPIKRAASVAHVEDCKSLDAPGRLLLADTRAVPHVDVRALCHPLLLACLIFLLLSLSDLAPPRAASASTPASARPAAPRPRFLVAIVSFYGTTVDTGTERDKSLTWLGLVLENLATFCSGYNLTV